MANQHFESDKGDSHKSGQEVPAPKRPSAEKPVSLHPLKFEEAVRGLLAVRPPETSPKSEK